MQDTPSSRQRGVDRLLALLAHLHGAGEPVRIGDLAKALGAPRSTIYELVRTLTEAGLLETRGADNRIAFGKLMHLYGANYIRHNDLIRRGSAEVERLATATGETSELCVRHHNRQAIVHMHPGSRPQRISSEVGAQIPLPWTASGRLLLAHMEAAEIETLIADDDLNLPDGRRTGLADFVDDCHAARVQDIVTTKGLINSFTQCLAAPIYGVAGTIEATICLVTPIDIPDAQTEALKTQLRAASKKLSLFAQQP